MNGLLCLTLRWFPAVKTSRGAAVSGAAKAALITAYGRNPAPSDLSKSVDKYRGLQTEELLSSHVDLSALKPWMETAMTTATAGEEWWMCSHITWS